MEQPPAVATLPWAVVPYKAGCVTVKVGQILAGRAHGGAELFYDRLVPALHERVPQFAIVRPEGTRAEALAAAGVPTYPFRFGSRHLDWRTRFGIARTLRRESADLAITWMSRASQLTRPGVCPVAARLGGFYPMRNFRHCRRFIPITEGLARHVEAAGVPRDRIHVIGNFADETDAEPVARRTFDTPTDAPLLFACGRLHANKGFDVFLHAMTRVPGAYAWIAGDGPLEASLRALCTRLGLDERVRFLGWRAPVNAFLRTADAFVCPSRHEPHGNIVLEAWAHGCPIVATDTHGPAELIEHRRTGWLCANEDADEMARGISQVLGDRTLAAELAEAGRARYLERFSSAHILDRYEEFIDVAVREP